MIMIVVTKTIKRIKFCIIKMKIELSHNPLESNVIKLHTIWIFNPNSHYNIVKFRESHLVSQSPLLLNIFF